MQKVVQIHLHAMVKFTCLPEAVLPLGKKNSWDKTFAAGSENKIPFLFRETRQKHYHHPRWDQLMYNLDILGYHEQVLAGT